MMVMHTLWLTCSAIILRGFVIWVLYRIALITYRLTLHPIANFPGPKLAAATYWYEAYYDFISLGGGQFAFRVKKMHEEYGPIVRIAPDELHIDDPDYYDVVFCTSPASRPIDKMERFRYRLNHPDSTLSTVRAEDHRIRRAAIAPFFARTRVRGYNDHVQGIVDQISSRLTREYKGKGHIVRVHHLWASLTTDMIMELAFGHPSRMREAPDFISPIPEATQKIAFLAHYATHFPIIGFIFKFLPDGVLNVMAPVAKPLFDFRRDMRDHLNLIGQEKRSSPLKSPRHTIFHDILESNLPPKDKSLGRLTQEAMLVNGAAVETTTWTLTVGTFYIIYDTSIHRRLKAELVDAMPDEYSILTWDELEKLCYLKAIIMESLRLSFGSVQRLPRVNRLHALKYRGLEIPPNVAVGMDAFHMHMNERIFPNAADFLPERWLGNPTGPDGVTPLSHYLVSFSRGARACLGKDLAMMELYVAFATIFRRHNFELVEGNKDDVIFAKDVVKPMPKAGSKEVRVVVI